MSGRGVTAASRLPRMGKTSAAPNEGTHHHPTWLSHASSQFLECVVHHQVQEHVESSQHPGDVPSTLKMQVESSVHELCRGIGISAIF